MSDRVYAKARCQYCGIVWYPSFERWEWNDENFRYRCGRCGWTEFEWMKVEGDPADRDVFGYRLSPPFEPKIKLEPPTSWL